MCRRDEAKQPSTSRRAITVVAVVGVGLGAVAGLVGCAVGPDFRPPAPSVPETWHAAATPEWRDAAPTQITTQAAAGNRWWSAFHDAILDRLIELAYRQNLPLEVAGLRIVEARAQVAVAKGQLFPQVQLASGSATAVQISHNVPIASALPHQFIDYQVGFDASWELDFWGKYQRGVEAQKAHAAASAADYDAALVSLTAEVARAYVGVRTYEVLIELARDNTKLEEEALAIADSRFRNGATSELDPVQAKTQLETTKASIPQLVIGLQQTRNALSTLLAQPAGSVEALLTGPREIPKAPPKIAVGVPAELLRRRPDIRSAELNAAAQSARIGAVKADLYPKFSLVGNIGLEATSAGASQNLFSAGSLFYAFGPQISWQIFTYGRITNAVRAEDARYQELLVAYRDAVIKAAQEVEDALSGFLNAQAAAAFDQDAVKAAQRSVELALIMYREGSADFLRVLDAQRALLERQDSLAQTTSSVAMNMIALYKALGGGWELRQGQPIVPEQAQREMRARTGWGDLLSRPPASETTNPSNR